MRARRQGTRLPDGRWQIRLRIDGKLRAFYGKTQREVQALVRGFEKAPAPTTPTLGNFLDDWLEQSTDRLRPRTLDRYKQVAVHIQPARHIKLEALTPFHIEQLMQIERDRGNSRTPGMLRAVLSSCLKDAMRKGLIKQNVAQLARPMTIKTEARSQIALSDLETIRTRELRPVLRALWRFLAETGMRPAEALSLTWKEVRREKDGYWVQLEQSKTPAGMKPVPIRADLAAELLGIRTSIYVFPTSKGTPYSHRNVLRAWKQVLEVAEIPYTNPYQLRKLFGRTMAEKVPEYVLKDLMRHESAQTTRQFYLSAEKTRLREAIES